MFFTIPFTFSSSFSQNKEVIYKFSIVDTKDQYGIVGFAECKLIANVEESVMYARNIDTTAVIKGLEEPHYQNASEFTPSVYKKPFQGLKYSEVFFRKYDLKDHSYTIDNWELIDGNKTILNYNCFLAKGSYRGRNYLAYYAPDIPIQSGPGAFDNLPGLILEVISDDQVIHYVATEIKDNSDKIENPFITKPYISWEQFQVEYEKHFNKMINYKPDENTTIVIPNRGIELYLLKEK